MDIEEFLEIAKKLDSKKKGKEEEFEKFRRFFERFYLLNRAYLDKEVFEKVQGSIITMAESVAHTIRYLDSEIVRLRHKGRKQPFEVVALAEMQKVQRKNEMLLKEFLS